MTSIDLAAYLFLDEVWVLVGFFLLMVVPKAIVSAWNHHHQHNATFHSQGLNRCLELLYGLHTGIPTNMWVLHHVLGHHLNYLDQTRDESRWKSPSGEQMGELEYTVRTALTAYPRALAVGRRHPRARRPFLIYGSLLWLLVFALTWFRPLSALFVFVLPMITTLFFTAWVTYDHHAGLDTGSPFDASYNIMHPWFNRLTGNLGYHTAHHYRQGIHWSRLPVVHAEIAHRIPAHCYVQSVFEVLLPREPTQSSITPNG